MTYYLRILCSPLIEPVLVHPIYFSASSPFVLAPRNPCIMRTVRISYNFVQSNLGLPKKKKSETQEVTRMDMQNNKWGIIVDSTLKCHGRCMLLQVSCHPVEQRKRSWKGGHNKNAYSSFSCSSACSLRLSCWFSLAKRFLVSFALRRSLVIAAQA